MAYFTVREGNIPLILVALHGGKDCPPEWPIRQDNGNHRADCKTIALLTTLEQTMKQQWNQSPYVCFVKLHRKYGDMNRSIDECSTLEDVKQVWTDVHGWIQMQVAKWRKGVVIDIHGYHDASGTGPIYRGTCMGKTFYRENLDEIQLSYPMYPAKWSIREEYARYQGGYLTRSFCGSNWEAIQLEFPEWIRYESSHHTRWAEEFLLFLNRIKTDCGDNQ